jgi:hypothetical protein
VGVEPTISVSERPAATAAAVLVVEILVVVVAVLLLVLLFLSLYHRASSLSGKVPTFFRSKRVVQLAVRASHYGLLALRILNLVTTGRREVT